MKKAKKRGAHRKRREAVPYAGMMLHQDGNTHEWVPIQYWGLTVTMDDATNEHYSIFCAPRKGRIAACRVYEK